MWLRLLILFLSSYIAQSFAMTQYDISRVDSVTDITQYQQLIEKVNVLSPEMVATDPQLNWLEINRKDSFKAKQGRNWYAFELYNGSFEQVQSVYLVITDQIRLDSIEVFGLTAEDALQRGNSIYIGDYSVAQHIKLKPQQRMKLYLRVDASLPSQMPVKLYSDEAFLQKSNRSLTYNGLMVGALMCLAFVQLVLFGGTQNKSFALLSGYFVTRALLLASILGWNLVYFWPTLIELKGVDIPILISLSTLLLLQFNIELFRLKKHHVKLFKTLHYISLLLIVFVPLSLWFNSAMNIVVSTVIYLCSTLILLVLAYYLHQKQIRLARLFFTISTVEIIFVLTVILGITWHELGLFNYKKSLYFIGFMLNSVLFTYLVSRQFFYETSDKNKAQKLALDNATRTKRAQEQLLALQQENQEVLEQKVQERTLELNIALQELEQLNQELELKNMQDELSGLNNRRFYDQKMLAEYRRSKRNLTPLSLVIIDIDHFKKINDTYGHIAGDYCIEQIGSIIKHTLKRSTDICCRYGGEEFCLILPEQDKQGAIDLAEKLRRLIEKQQVIYQDDIIKFTISCGVTTYMQQENVDPEIIFSVADKALYQAKQQGRNQVQFLPITSHSMQGADL